MVQVHGHRGARARFPENTIPAFEYAISVGADAIEMDLWATRDNVVVVSHDPTLPDGPIIRRLALSELNSRLPTLDQALALAGRGSFVFNLEIKSFPDRPDYGPTPEQIAALVMDRIRVHGLENRTIIQSFDFRVLQAVRRLDRAIPRSALFEDDPRPFAELAAEAGHTGLVSPEFRLVTLEKVDAAHAAGLQVLTWTPNTPVDWDSLVADGVDAIITDDPAALIAHLNR